jgi:formylglycine-generating enzyme required for sulfatase activity
MARLEARKLRDLVNDFYHGLITLESYREQRAELLDNIGRLPVKPPDSATTAVERRPAVPAEPETAGPEPAGKSRTPLMVGIGVLVVAAAAAFVMLSTPDRERESASPGTSGEVTVSDPGTAIIAEFLNRNDWSRDSMANFLIAWNALDEEQREEASQQRAYRRLTTSLHQRIREEAALSATPTARFRSMTKFAEDLGAPYRLAGSAAADRDMATPPGSGPAETSEREDEAFDEQSIQGSRAVPAEEETIDSTAAPVVDSRPDTDANTVAANSNTENKSQPESTDDVCPASIANTRQPYCSDTLAVGGEGPILVVIRAGSFDMGSEANSEESPVHRVTIGMPIAVSRYEISVAEFKLYCAAVERSCPENPWGADDFPVVNVSWDDAVGYAAWLSEQTGRSYRLPTEAEWEYAARAGTTTPFFFGDEVTPSSAHSSANGPNDMPLPSSERRVNRNPFRLYHMSGNVREWVQDSWYRSHEGAPADGSARVSDTESARVVRGGSYSDIDDRLRSAAREPLGRSHRDSMTGIRVVREVTATSH